LARALADATLPPLRPPKQQPPDRRAGIGLGDLRLRVLSAAVLAPIGLVCLWIGSWAWVGLIGLAGVGVTVEWLQLCGQRVRRGSGLPIVATRLAGALCLGLAAAALIWLRADQEVGRANVLFLMLVVWATDTGAYAAGRLAGGPKLCPRISPRKTWAGAGGGVACAMTVGFVVAHIVSQGLVPHALVAAAGLSVVAQAGDLLESAVKRHFGVKDSGHLIPGHGGFLDRLDGFLAVAPVAALLASAFGRGAVLWQ
jgi:phosphatidate cytidylyltransferase